MMGILKGLFGGSTFKSIEKIATEWIETDTEQAEAKTMMVKALDPNGQMRRNISDRVTALYTLYIVVMLSLLIAESFGLGPTQDGQLAVSLATEKVTDVFATVTTLFGLIVGASFGVNYANVKNGK